MTRRRSRLLRSLPIAVALAAMVAFVAPAGAYDAADGRRHAQRASHLAASGKCKQAIGEFDKALAVLHDPALLFNRAECHRKLGATDAALEDYNQFLIDLPTAPNRAQVETRIAELKKASAAEQAEAAGPAARTDAATAKNSTAGAGAVAKSPAPVPTAAPTPAANGRVGDRSSLSTDAAGSADEPGEIAPLIDKAEPTGTAPGRGNGRDSLATRPWFWIAIAAVVIGAGVGGFLVFGRDGTSIPSSDLGNYKF